MEAIIQRVIEMLLAREKSSFSLSVQAAKENENLSDEIFIKNKFINLTDVDVLFLENLLQRKENPLIQWIYRSFSFCCQLSIQLGFEDLNLIPLDLLSECPARLYSIKGNEITWLKGKILTYQDVALLTNKDCLLLATDQKLTALAKESLEQQGVTIFERS